MREIEPFTHVWPSGEINRYDDDELRPLAFTATKGGKRAHFIIGRVHPDRPQLGRRRWRYNVFLTSSPGSPQGVRSILDFVAGNKFEVDGEMASLIKLPSGKFLRETTQFRRCTSTLGWLGSMRSFNTPTPTAVSQSLPTVRMLRR